MTACWTLVAGRILGVLIRCPLVFCTFWLFSDDSCTHPRLSQFSCLWQWAILLRPSPFPASAVFRHLYLLFQWYPYPLGLYPARGCVHRSSFLFVRYCFCCRLSVVVNTKSSHSGTSFWRRRGANGSECQRSSQRILKSCQTHGSCPTMSYSN